MLYSLIATAAAVLWEAINISSAKLIEKAMGPQSSAFAGGTATIVTGFLLRPMYERFKKSVDKRLTPETLDLSDEFPEFEPDVRSRLTVAARRQRAGGAHSGPVRDRGQRRLPLRERRARAVRGARLRERYGAQRKPSTPKRSTTLRAGTAARGPAKRPMPRVRAIVVPRAKNPDLLGVLVLGRRGGEKGYSQLEISALEVLGRKAGMALFLSEARAATTAPA